jgi:serine/threonine protein kinase/tetratricopeptide (TPR) repeat protein
MDADFPGAPAFPGYVLGKRLGRGGMGVVYQATQRALKRPVALKMIRADRHVDPAQLGRFRVEAEALGRLRHPHVVQIYEIGESGGVPYFSLELLEGGTLAERLDGAPMSPRPAAELTVTLARTMAAVHRVGIVHRDLKPSNVLFDAAGTPKVTDFGLAKRLEDEEGEGQTISGQVMGTPSYMAREQALGQTTRIGPPADIYALGAILYEMLTGRPPFRAPSSMETLGQVIFDEPVRPSRLQPRVPRDLETIGLKCLAKSPARRYATGDDLADDLERFLAGRPIRARPTPVWEHAAKWARRRPATATLLALGVTVAIGVLALGLRHHAERERAATQESLRIADRRGQSDKILDRAQACLDEKRWTEGRYILSNLLTSLQAEPRLADVSRRARTLLEKVERGIETERVEREELRRLDHFVDLRNAAHFHATRFNGLDLLENNLQATRVAARGALGVFGVPGPGDAWSLSRLPASLSPRQRTEIVDGCYELLLVLAEAVAEVLPGEDPAAQADRGLRVLDQAARLRSEPTRAYHLRRAACLVRKHDETGAARARTAAERLRSTTTLDHFLDGRESFQQGRWSLAVREFETVLRLQPDHFWAQCLAAICALKTSQPATAKIGLSVCLQREPDFAWLYILRGFAAGQSAAQLLAAAKTLPTQDRSLQGGAEIQFDAALEDYRAAMDRLERKPNNVLRYALLVNRGLLQSQRGTLDEAVADFQEAIRLNDRQYEACAGLAQIYARQKKWDESIEQFTRAIALRPGWSPLYRGRAEVQQERDDSSPAHREAALGDLEAAIEHEEPGNTVLASDHTRRGALLRGSQRFDAALEACDAALEIVPDYDQAHRLRVMVLLDLKRDDEVIRDCDGALAQGKPWADIHEIRGLARAGRGDFAGAIEDYSQALAQRPGQPRVLCSRGQAYLVSDAPRLALRDFDEALRLDAASGEAHGGRGLALARLGDHRGAIAAAEESLRHDPAGARRTYNAARVYAQAAVTAAAETTSRGQPAVVLVDRYHDRAVALVQAALERLPAERRAAFWEGQIAPDPALRSLQRRLRGLQPSRATLGPATHGNDPSPGATR